MKILVISETSSVLQTYSDFFTENGFDTICYSWLLKALDNIDEIKPDAVVVNSIDYPRHWKTLVQYMHSMHERVSSIFVIVPQDIEEDEQKKLDALKVTCVHDDFNHTNEGDKILELLKAQPENTVEVAYEAKIAVPEIEEEHRIVEIHDASGSENNDDIEVTVFEPEDNKENQLLTEKANTGITLAKETFEIIETNEEPLESFEAEHNLNVEAMADIEDADDSEITMSTDTNAEVFDIEEQVIDEDNTADDFFEDTIGEEIISIEEEIDSPEITLTDDLDENEKMYFTETEAENIFEDDSHIESEYSTWLTCPIADSNEIVNGAVLSYEHPIMHFSPTDKDAIKYFSFGKKIESCTLTDDGYQTIITVQVQGFENDFIELCVVK